MIEDLIRGLATGSDLSAEEILDVLWLSAIRAGPRPAPAAEPAAPPVADRGDDPERERASPPDNPLPPPTDDDEGEEAAGLLLRLPDGEPDGDVADADSEPGELIPAAEVAFGAPRPIRDAAALPRALRRLRQVRRPGPRLAVDVDATVEATADAGGMLVPVFTRPLERSLDLALVVDGAPAMRVESRHQLGGPLSALIPDPDGSAALDPAAEPFAALHEALATRLGLRAGPDRPAAPIQPPSGVTPTEPQEIPESLLAALVDEISRLRPNDFLRVFTFDATGLTVSQVGRDKHGDASERPLGHALLERRRLPHPRTSPPRFRPASFPSCAHSQARGSS